jgi:sugar/nucleoside kinase (ribokinase family)
MRSPQAFEPIDYLVIGHITQDLTPHGTLIGGTASYSALTAKALGLRVGIVTACTPDLEAPELEGIQIAVAYAEHNTTFQNINTPSGRIQYLHHRAPLLTLANVPEIWRRTPIVHLGPVAQEVDANLARAFADSLVCLTPQGWLRAWDEADKRVHPCEWPESSYVLSHAAVAILSVEDVQGDESRIDDMISAIKTMVVTEGYNGARLYWNGDLRRFYAPQVPEVDPTGAGDIFATSFFYRLFYTNDPWEAARFATQIASQSVTRPGLQGVPTPDEIKAAMIEVITKG